MKIILVFVLMTFISCKKSNEGCDTWIARYWQGKADYTTITANYYPYNKDENICGSGKDTIVKNKNIIISKTGTDIYNYKTFIAKR